MEKLIVRARGVLLDIFSDVGLFALLSFLHTAFSGASVLVPYSEALFMMLRYLLIPWGVALCLMRLQRAQQNRLFSADTVVLALLIVWCIVPFALRFGVTYNSATSWHGNIVAYLGIYAMLMEEDSARRARELDRLCALSAAVSVLLGGALLYTAVAVKEFGTEYGEFCFGILNGTLCAGVNYNATAMPALALAMLCLTGAARRRHPLAKAAHVIPAAMMMLVVVLTQSRTSRLALLMGLAVCVYGVICTNLKGSAALRHGVGIVCGLAVLVLGYAGEGAITRVAVAHYNQVRAMEQTAAEPDDRLQALARTAAEHDDGTQGSTEADAGAENRAEDAATPKPTQKRAWVRPGFDATLSERTLLWKNLFAFWRENPKYVIIGYGPGRVKSLVVQGTMHQGVGGAAVHNTYLQFIADYGLIGFAMITAFFLIIAKPVLRSFYARGKAHVAGAHVLGGLVVAALAIGMVESAPLEGLTQINTMLCVALAILVADGRRAEH